MILSLESDTMKTFLLSKDFKLLVLAAALPLFVLTENLVKQDEDNEQITASVTQMALLCYVRVCFMSKRQKRTTGTSRSTNGRGGSIKAQLQKGLIFERTGEFSLRCCSPVLLFFFQRSDVSVHLRLNVCQCQDGFQSVLWFSSSEIMVIRFWRPKM